MTTELEHSEQLKQLLRDSGVHCTEMQSLKEITLTAGDFKVRGQDGASVIFSFDADDELCDVEIKIPSKG